MFGAKESTRLDNAIDRALQTLESQEVGSEDYVKTLNALSELYKMRDKPDRVSLDTAIIVAANLMGIMMIIRHEHVNVITSRAMGLVMKPR